MPDRRRDVHTTISNVRDPATDVALQRPRFNSVYRAVDTNNGTLTAAAQIVTELGQKVTRNESWQDEAWSFYESLGEFNYGVEWFGEAMSRVRLAAAKVTSGGDEPEIITDGPVAEIISAFMGGVDGHAQLLRSLAIQLSVAGDAYFIGRDVTDSDEIHGLLMDAEPDENGRIWTIHSSTTVRRSRRRFTNMLRRGGLAYNWEVQVDEGTWVPLPMESLTLRIWDRNERMPWRAMSPAKAALPIMREIDMYNRHVIASLVSRLAMNGMLLIPDEVALPASSKYENASDPFIAEMLDIMMSAIKNPGSPAAAAPMPVRIPAEFINSFKHLTFATALDGTVMESRKDALRRLATTLNLPAEVITGMGDVNHWSAWQLSEDAIKIHISPKIELITRALTLGYLHPMLRALNEPIRSSDGSRYIIWYDTSELTQRPDRSGSAIKLREMMVISDAATRRETGFDESDAPTNDELERMILQKLAVNPQLAVTALKELTGLELTDISPSAGPVGPSGGVVDTTSDADNMSSDSSDDEASQAPETRDATPPPPDSEIVASARRNMIIARTKAVRESLTRDGYVRG